MRIFVAISLIIAAFAANGEARTKSEFSICMDAAAGVDPAMHECMAAERMRHDEVLNATYQRLMRELPEPRKKALLAAQRLWIKYVEANCAFYNDPDGGSLARLSANSCRMDETARRAQELAEIEKSL